ncbi:MAG: AarF/UbiB family protein [Gaiellaceae bacterium]
MPSRSPRRRSPRPTAACSPTGHDVVVKVRRPGVVEHVELDLALLRSTVRLAVGHSEAARRVQLEELAEELEVHLRAKLGGAGFCLAGALGLYMVWKIIRTPGEL